MKKLIFLFPFLLIPKLSFAHCPLCATGAGILAVFAASIGVSATVVGVFIGAFSVALSIWVSKMVKKKYFKYQDLLLSLFIFLLTVIPIMPLIREYRPLYISLSKEYGTLLHNTYLINLYILGVVVGSMVFLISPFISKKIIEIKGNRLFPYQGLIITFILLIFISIILQFLI